MAASSLFIGYEEQLEKIESDVPNFERYQRISGLILQVIKAL